MSDSAAIRSFKAGQLWQPGGWQAEAMLGVDAAGRLVKPAATSVEPLGAWVLPGMPNLHSHAFQRAMAGLAERKGRVDDSFWSWRETMYAFAAAIGPDELKAVAAQLYVEMLKAGYTQVCEFQYLHHQPDGTPYAQPETMSLALIEAAHEAGIALTLLPVLYISGGFDGRALTARQRRFGHAVDGYLRLLETLRRHESDDLRVGIALHSLRAVPELAMREVLASDMAKTCPIHIHIAEQIGEVQDCLATRGARPVQWRVYVPLPKRILATACFRWPITSMPLAYSASVRIRTSRSRRWRNCAGWNTASACRHAIATSLRGMKVTAWARHYGGPRCMAAHRRPACRSANCERTRVPT